MNLLKVLINYHHFHQFHDQFVLYYLQEGVLKRKLSSIPLDDLYWDLLVKYLIEYYCFYLYEEDDTAGNVVTFDINKIISPPPQYNDSSIIAPPKQHHDFTLNAPLSISNTSPHRRQKMKSPYVQRIGPNIHNDFDLLQDEDEEKKMKETIKSIHDNTQIVNMFTHNNNNNNNDNNNDTSVTTHNKLQNKPQNNNNNDNNNNNNNNNNDQFFYGNREVQNLKSQASKLKINVSKPVKKFTTNTTTSNITNSTSTHLQGFTKGHK